MSGSVATTFHRVPSPRSGALLLILTISLGCVPIDEGAPAGGTGTNTGSSREAIVGGTATTAYPGVGALVTAGGGRLHSFCTGSLIHHRWVLTAAHCLVDERGRLRSTDGVSFFLGPDTRDRSGGLLIGALGFYIHQDYEPADPAGGTPPVADIGLVSLATTAGDTPRYGYNTESLFGTEGATLTWVGYGVNRPPTSGSGIKRAGSGPLGSVYWWHLVYEFEGQLPCSGDSGGATFMTVGGRPRLVGIISTADEDCDEGGTSLRIDTFAPWIRRTMARDPDAASCHLPGGDCDALACWFAADDTLRCYPTEGLELGDECNPDGESWETGVPCADGLACVQTTADSTVGRCFQFCEEGDCPAGLTCRLDLVSEVPGVGLCASGGGEPCDLLGGDCGAGSACLPLPGEGGGICRDSADLGLDEECDPDQTTWDPAPCADGLICHGDGPFSADGNCMQMCFEDSDCGGSETCRGPIYTNVERLGVCECTDFDGDGFCSDEDCDDENRNVNPGRDERCGDRIDNNCNGSVDEGCDCTDDDGDGFCAESDCDDSNPDVNPDAEEACDDEVDNDCDGDIDGDDSDCATDPDGGPDDGGPDDGGPDDGGPDDGGLDDGGPDDGGSGDAGVDAGDDGGGDEGGCSCSSVGRGFTPFIGYLGALLFGIS